MIFAMVGMHTKPFDRLIKAFDDYAGAHADVTMLIQIGCATYEPRHARFFRFKDTLTEELDVADAIVTQGGFGIFEAVLRRKPLVVVPRMQRFDECVNDHQVELARRMSVKYGFAVVEDCDLLGAAIDTVRATGVQRASVVAVPPRLPGIIRDYVNSLDAGGTHA